MVAAIGFALFSEEGRSAVDFSRRQGIFQSECF
jgi:hypothetical protein